MCVCVCVCECVCVCVVGGGGGGGGRGGGRGPEKQKMTWLQLRRLTCTQHAYRRGHFKESTKVCKHNTQQSTAHGSGVTKNKDRIVCFENLPSVCRAAMQLHSYSIHRSSIPCQHFHKQFTREATIKEAKKRVEVHVQYCTSEHVCLYHSLSAHHQTQVSWVHTHTQWPA